MPSEMPAILNLPISVDEKSKLIIIVKYQRMYGFACNSKAKTTIYHPSLHKDHLTMKYAYSCTMFCIVLNDNSIFVM